MYMKKHMWTLFGIALVLGLFLAVATTFMPKRTDRDKVMAWKPRDFVLVYRYYFDPEIIALRKIMEPELELD